MIAGIIVLSIFLTATVTMLFIGQQNDSYRTAMLVRQQRDIDMFSEDLVAVYPGLSPEGAQGGVNQWVMNMSNYGGVDVHLARIYINSSASPGCYPGCVLNPSATPTPNSFRVTDGVVNAGEFGHQVLLWLPTSITLNPPTSTVAVATTRGRIFRFQYPFPLKAAGSGGSGGTGLNFGPLTIRVETDMITYSVYNGSQPNTYPRPIANNPNGGWIFPFGSNTAIIFFIKIYSQGVSPVTLASESSFQAIQFGTPGNIQNFFLIAPMSTSLCTSTFLALNPYTELPYCSDFPPTGIGSIPGGNTAPSKTGGVTAYSSQNPYIIPTPPQPGVCCSQPVWLLFSATKEGSLGTTAQALSVSSSNPPVFYTYLNLVFQYDDGGGPYTYAVDLPFLTLCAGPATSQGSGGSYTASCPVTEA